jgi:hypothetical protein
MSFRDTAVGTPNERRVAVNIDLNEAGTGLLAIGYPIGSRHEWTRACGLDRNDMMILSDMIREVAETLPWEPPC